MRHSTLQQQATSRRSLRFRGFTILEMLTVIGIIGFITTVIAGLFSQGSLVLRHGDGRLSLQRANRLLGARVTPYVASTFNRSVGAPVVLDPLSNVTPAAGTTDKAATVGVAPTVPGMSALRFVTTEDWFAVGYPTAAGTSATQVTDLSQLGSFVYQIRRNAQNNVILEQLDRTNNYAAVGAPQVLFFSRESAYIKADADPLNPVNFKFELPRDNLLIMTVTLTSNIRGAVDRMDLEDTFRTTFNLPSKGI